MPPMGPDMPPIIGDGPAIVPGNWFGIGMPGKPIGMPPIGIPPIGIPPIGMPPIMPGCTK